MKILHLTEKFTQAPPVVPVTNMRYGLMVRQVVDRDKVGIIRI